MFDSGECNGSLLWPLWDEFGIGLLYYCSGLLLLNKVNAHIRSLADNFKLLFQSTRIMSGPLIMPHPTLVPQSVTTQAPYFGKTCSFNIVEIYFNTNIGLTFKIFT